MPLRLDARDPGFGTAFAGLPRDEARGLARTSIDAVRAIIADVVARGDEALVDLSKKFDRVDLGALGIRVCDAEIEAATAPCATRRRSTR